ncbi:T9SS type A sorting domain-containing protein [Fulvivirgaceae bacterium BMA10]|uniref:T9SS type A sorting domain-containing protein n=1 Tax=Splendidivirga corallicola TaxID=3051826 RepID=A0ABT8KSQ7_9BACT|nr:T9SS type A sorting domain-containing protein [Fulvivirgaceae bacterium BMA10]
MNFRFNCYFFCGLVVLILLSQNSWAQIELMPISRVKIEAKNKQQLRTAEEEPIELPFWDDFSTASNIPDVNKWLGSQNVYISNSIGVAPPSFNVAAFDGVDVNGNAYSFNPNASGLGDSLLSFPIDLSAIEDALKNTVYISFYWQLSGMGEFPDAGDSIRLQFKDQNGDWVTVWNKTGGDMADPNVFTQEIIQVDPDLYFHDTFQFRFQSFSRLSGIFDTWNIDYVYLNKRRSPTDLVYFDRTVSSVLTSIFKNYSAIPANQFFSDETDQSTFIDSSKVELLNLDQLLQPMVYTAFLEDTLSKVRLDTMNLRTEVDPILQGSERRALRVNKIEPDKIPDAKRLVLESTFFIESGDTLLIDQIVGTDTTYHDNVDFRVNDTIRTTQILDNYYAYDDGSAEFAAGINQSGGRLAYQYVLSEPDTLTNIDIYFPTVGENFSGSPLTIFVWKDLDDENDQVAYEGNAVVQQASGINQLASYSLLPAIVVRDTIYIGYRQGFDGRLGVGLDRNTDSGDKLFFNVRGTWVQNTEIQGSLMMRPRFEEGGIITGNDKPTELDGLDKKITIYPNPGKGEFFIKGDFEDIRVYNTHGQLLTGRDLIVNSGNASVLNLKAFPNGIYIVQLERDRKIFTERIILNK